MLPDVLRHQPSPSTAGWRYVAGLAQTKPERFAGSAPAATTPRADGFDADAAWLLAAAHVCPALQPPKGPEQRRLDTALAEVCAVIDSSELQARNITLRLACGPIVLSGWRNWQICVIVADLLLAAARDGREVRSISVEFGLGEEARCVVVDDGVASPGSARSPGAVEVDGLVEEMGGRVVRCADETGCAVMVRVPRAALQP